MSIPEAACMFSDICCDIFPGTFFWSPAESVQYMQVYCKCSSFYQNGFGRTSILNCNCPMVKCSTYFPLKEVYFHGGFKIPVNLVFILERKWKRCKFNLVSYKLYKGPLKVSDLRWVSFQWVWVIVLVLCWCNTGASDASWSLLLLLLLLLCSALKPNPYMGDIQLLEYSKTSPSSPSPSPSPSRSGYPPLSQEPRVVS